MLNIYAFSKERFVVNLFFLVIGILVSHICMHAHIKV